MLWQCKKKTTDEFVDMKTPSSYKVSYEDLDSKTYRSITNGNMIRRRVSSKWFKGSFTFNYITQSEAEEILDMINSNPLYVRIKSPMFGTNGIVEFEAYVSKVSMEMIRNDKTNNNTHEWVDLTFNIVQTKVVNGQ